MSENVVINDGDLYAGIYLNGNWENQISNNAVVGDCDANYLVQASSGQTLEDNRADAGTNDGFRLIDSPDNIMICNLTEAADRGVAVVRSDRQEIRTTEFAGTADTDFYSNSLIGPQPLHGNHGWKSALAHGLHENFIFQNQFEVSDLSDCELVPCDGQGNPNYMPQDLFSFLSGEDETCTNPKGPTRPWTPDFYCWYIEYLAAQDNPNRRWISTYHLYRKFSEETPEEEWPGSSTGAERKSNNEQIRQYVNSRNTTLEELITSQTQQLKHSQSNKDIYQVWRGVYLLVLKERMSELSLEDIEYLLDIVQLCPAEYGDPIHWAKGLLSPHRKDYVIADENCAEMATPRERRDEMESGKYVNIFPNPVSEWLTIENHSVEKSFNFEITNLAGELFKEFTMIGKTIQLDISNYPNGLYLLKYHDDKVNEIEKFVIVH